MNCSQEFKSECGQDFDVCVAPKLWTLKTTTRKRSWGSRNK